MVRVPVRCPRCQVETRGEFPEQVVFMALTRWNNMNLYAPGHTGSWSATASDLGAIRSYLGEAWLAARGAFDSAQAAVHPPAGRSHSHGPAVRLC